MTKRTLTPNSAPLIRRLLALALAATGATIAAAGTGGHKKLPTATSASGSAAVTLLAGSKPPTAPAGNG